MPWRRACQPAPVSLPGESHGQRSLAGCSPRGRRESDTTERVTTLDQKPPDACVCSFLFLRSIVLFMYLLLPCHRDFCLFGEGVALAHTRARTHTARPRELLVTEKCCFRPESWLPSASVRLRADPRRQEVATPAPPQAAAVSLVA